MRRRGPQDRAGLLKAIHALGRALRLDDETRRTMQANLTGRESCKDMSEGQLKKVYGALSVLGDGAGLRRQSQHSGLSAQDSRRRRGRDERQPEELATIEQGLIVRHLFEDLESLAAGPVAPTWRLELSKRVCGASWPQTREQANKVIECLKAMRARGWRPRTTKSAVECHRLKV